MIRRVLEGGVGCESGGMLERSMESDGRECDREEWPAGDAGSERGGDTDSAMVC